MVDSDDKPSKRVFDEKDGRMARLNDLRVRALHSGDYLKYSLYNEFLGITPEDIDLNEQGINERKSDFFRAEDIENELKIALYGDDYVNQSIKAPINIREENFKNFGIKADMFSHLPYETVREIFFGLHNFNCPELYRYMNPTEVLGLWAGVDRKESTFRSCMIADSPVETLSAIVSAGYESSSKAPKSGNEMNLGMLAQIGSKDTHIYSTAPGDLKERLLYVSDDVLEKVVMQLSQPKRFTDKERFTAKGFDGKNLIYDPNSDVKRPSNATKNLYADTIMNILEQFYKESVVDKS